MTTSIGEPAVREPAPVEPRGVVRLVAQREITSRLRSKAFRYSTLLTLLALAAAVVVPGLLSGDDKAPRVAVAGLAAGELRQGTGTGTADLELRDARTPADARRAVADGDAALAVVVTGGETRLLVTSSTPATARTAVAQLLQERASAAELRRQGVDEAALQRAVTAAVPEVEYVRGDASADQRVAVALIVSIVLFFQVFLYGIAVATGVVEEKSSRVVELLLVTVRPRQLLTGKVLGIGAVGLLQLLLYAVVGCGLALATGALDLPSAALLTTVAGAVAAFLVGFTFFGFAYGATASLVSRQEDVSSAISPVTTLALATYFTAVYAAGDLSAGWVGWLSYVPPFSVLLMPMQLAAGGVGLPGLLLATGVMAGVTVLTAWLGSVVYARSVLRAGRRTRLAQVLGRTRPASTPAGRSG